MLVFGTVLGFRRQGSRLTKYRVTDASSPSRGLNGGGAVSETRRRYRDTMCCSCEGRVARGASCSHSCSPGTAAPALGLQGARRATTSCLAGANRKRQIGL